MEYVKLNDHWKEYVRENSNSDEPHKFVVVELENGEKHSAELLNDKKLKLVKDIDTEEIEDIHIR